MFSDELEFLQNVYFDDLTYESCDQSSHILQFRVTPSTGDDKEKQYVYLVLNITVAKEVRVATIDLHADAFERKKLVYLFCAP